LANDQESNPPGAGETNETVAKAEYEALKAELEAEKVKTTEAVALAVQPYQERVTALENTIAGQQVELNEKVGKLEALQGDFEGAKAAYAYAVEDFRKLAAISNPLVPSEAIYGNSVEEIKVSLDRANKLVANVQEAIAKQTTAAQVPAGAPQRTGPNTENMSTKEKITAGLEQAKKKKES